MSDDNRTLEELARVRQRTLFDISRLKDDLLAEIEPASATDDDSADVAADIYERGKIISLIQSLEAKLHAVDHAIATATSGNYGRCEMCGEPIPEERLQIMPETTLCVRCAGKLEQGIRRRQIQIAYEQGEERPYGEDEDEELDTDDVDEE
ncbi:MAG: TraR/DksA C4-type zinc finger protein [Anaerolineae bacterium]